MATPAWLVCLMAAALTTATGARGQTSGSGADLTFTLDSNTGSGSATDLPPDANPPCISSNCIIFTGTLTDNDSDSSLLFLVGVSIAFSVSNPSTGFLSIDNTFDFDVPGVLSGDPAYATDNSGNPANRYTGPIFGIDIAPGTPAGVYSGAVTIDAAGGTSDPGHNGFTVTRNFTLTVNPAMQTGGGGSGGSIAQGGVVPIYSSSTSIEAASWISIFGTNLADSTATWNGDFPISLGGVSVTVDGKPAYLLYVSPTQINLQAPDDATIGTVNVVVTNSHGSFTSTVALATVSPSFNLLDSTHAAGVILTPNGSGAYEAGGVYYDLLGPLGAFAYKTRPVKPGEILELYGVGFGPTNPSVPAGQAFSGKAPTVYPVTITIGGVSANVSFAGITEAGLYQFNLTVPSAASGDQPLQATVNGVQTLPGPVVTIQ